MFDWLDEIFSIYFLLGFAFIGWLFFEIIFWLISLIPITINFN